ncbi:helix-turn-helix transcriptional regulator [Streptomyces sp. NPDC051172]|uniref:helix-turn-helix transcriptional regulator n=1 Tax=Streptomyces sp. NPDC051172 TaxID=3155796 RepID=UPI00342E8F6C
MAETLGELLRAERVRAGLTQQQLADFATVGVRTVRDLESGRCLAPRQGTVRLLAEQLGMSRAARARLEELARRGAVRGGGSAADVARTRGERRQLAARITRLWQREGAPVVWLAPLPRDTALPAPPDPARTLLVLDGDDPTTRPEDVVRLMHSCPGVRVVIT